MSVEFRQRRPGEYAKIAWKRKWLIILPAIAIATAVTWVVWQLPDLYESSTLIVVKPLTLPNSVVPTITEDSLTRQINSIAQVVTSRSSLEPLIKKYESVGDVVAAGVHLDICFAEGTVPPPQRGCPAGAPADECGLRREVVNHVGCAPWNRLHWRRARFSAS